jgi:16S rRNA (guanine966-N2)-methyltransferase
LRIISGKYRGKVLHPGKDFSARPTTDFAKESLFNILSNTIDFESIKVLDLFAGTGSIGFEFASRGSAHIDAVELNFKHYEFIKRTANQLKFESFRSIRSDVIRFIKSCPYKYDLIFADPPFDFEQLPQLPELILNSKILDPQGMFILEHPKNISFAGNKNMFDHRNYGNVHFSFFQSEKIL